MISDNTKYSARLEELLYGLIRESSTLPSSMVVKPEEFFGSPEFIGRKRKVNHKSTGQIVKLSFRRKPHNEDEGENYVFDSLVKEAYSLAFRRTNSLLGLL